MFGNSWHIGRIFGIPLRVHISWFLVFALVAWQGRSYFPYVLPQFPSWEYWTMGIVAALLLFASVLVHELGDRKSTRLNSSHLVISYAVFCLKKKKQR